jgi:hypothetical protein
VRANTWSTCGSQEGPRRGREPTSAQAGESPKRHRCWSRSPARSCSARRLRSWLWPALGSPSFVRGEVSNLGYGIGARLAPADCGDFSSVVGRKFRAGSVSKSAWFCVAVNGAHSRSTHGLAGSSRAWLVGAPGWPACKGCGGLVVCSGPHVRKQRARRQTMPIPQCGPGRAVMAWFHRGANLPDKSGISWVGELSDCLQ